MKTIATLLMSVGLATAAWAGPVATYQPKGVQQPLPPPGCDCFAPGLAIGIYGAGIIFEDGVDDDALGGGVLAEYFFTENIGVQGSYTLLATESEQHEFDAALVLRYPITEMCIAPYILGGAGYATNSNESWNLFLGGGIELRLPDVNCMGIFADAAYHWAEDDGDSDFTLIRIGLKFPLN